MSNDKIIEHVGLATQTNMGDDETILEVMIPELVPAAEGEVDKDYKEKILKVKVKNLAPGGKSEATIRISETVKCEYIGHRSNVSIPNIYLGEQVQVFQIGGTDRYFWKEKGRDDTIRTTEHVRFRIANKLKTVEDLNDSNTYFIEMDTRKGRRKIHISTSHGTKELVAYDIKIDTDKSTVEIVDDAGNGFKLHSIDPGTGFGHWRLWNREQSFLDINGPDAVLTTLKSVTVNSPSVTVNCAILVANATATATVNTPLFTVNATVAAIIKSPLTTIDGKLVVTDDVDMKKEAKAGSRAGAFLHHG
jgi:hypothetical protein